MLGKKSKVATINEALRLFAVSTTQIIAALDSVPMDLAGSDTAWGYGGGRDLSRLAQDARRRPGLIPVVAAPIYLADTSVDVLRARIPRSGCASPACSRRAG